MANRVRNIQIKFNVTEEEKKLIHKKMEELETTNMGAYLRKMAIDGYIVKIDTKDNTLALKRIGTNINQIAKRINETSRIYDSDIEEIKRLMNEIWLLQKSMLSKAL